MRVKNTETIVDGWSVPALLSFACFLQGWTVAGVLFGASAAVQFPVWEAWLESVRDQDAERLAPFQFKRRSKRKAAEKSKPDNKGKPRKRKPAGKSGQ